MFILEKSEYTPDFYMARETAAKNTCLQPTVAGFPAMDGGMQPSIMVNLR